MNNSKFTPESFLGDDPSKALNSLAKTFNEHIIPFLNEWWEPSSPIPSDTDVQTLIHNIKQRISENPLPESYEQFEELLIRLSIAWRFNRRNFVNIHPSPFIPSILASSVVAIQQPNNIVQEVSEATWKMEHEAVEWMAKNLFGIEVQENGAWGNVVSGGTIANITAMMMARDYIYDKLSRPKPRRIGERGIIEHKSGVVLGTTASHYSIKKALWVLGIGSENFITAPVAYDEVLRRNNYKEQRFIKGIQDSYWKDRIRESIESDIKRGDEELENFYNGVQEPFSLQPLQSEIYKNIYSCFTFDVPLISLVLTLGTTDTGTLETLDPDTMEFLRKEDIFIHGDAASGGFGLLIDSVAQNLNKLDFFDSFTVDPHKMGLLHYPCGAVIFRDQGFKDQIKHEAPYLGPLAPTIEGSRSGSPSAGLWYAIQSLGVEGYRTAINQFLEFTRHLVQAFNGSSFQILHKVQLNAVAVAPLLPSGMSRSKMNRIVLNLRDVVASNGKFMINLDRGIAQVKVLDIPSDKASAAVDIYALRIVITNPLVQLSDAQELVEELETSLKKVMAK